MVAIVIGFHSSVDVTVSKELVNQPKFGLVLTMVNIGTPMGTLVPSGKDLT